MKIAIIGGNSQSTPNLLEYLSGIENIPAIQIALIGRNKDNLASILRAAKVLSQGTPIIINHAGTQTSELEAALEGAGLVILQIRVGGYSARDFDETFPLKYGLCGDEGLGIGGLSAAWRAWPRMQPLLHRINSAAPGALLVILSSPVGILVRAAIHVCNQMQVVGICELPWTTLSEVCHTLNVDVLKVRYEYLGVNHLGWFYHISTDGRDLINEYARVRQGDYTFPSSELIERCRGIPTKYFELHFNSLAVVKRQRTNNQTRGRVLEELSKTAFSVFSKGTADEIKTILSNRPAPWYRYAIGPLILGLTGRKTLTPFFLSILNRGYDSELADNDVLEIPHSLRNRRFLRHHRIHQVPGHISKLTSDFAAAEKLAALAILEHDITYLEKSLKSHPWTKRSKQIPDMLRDIVRE
jgi:6-phospho-beta-glucosidase